MEDIEASADGSFEPPTAPLKAKKPVGYNWSKTKQVVRKQSAEAGRAEAAKEWRQSRKDEQFKKRELKKAKKLLGAAFTGEQRRSGRERAQVVRDDFVQH